MPGPKIITYVNLLHKHKDTEAKEVQDFVEQHKQDAVFVKRSKKLNEIYALIANFV